MKQNEHFLSNETLAESLPDEIQYKLNSFLNINIQVST